eukprot:2791276-Rhodomonas_salina.1
MVLRSNLSEAAQTARYPPTLSPYHITLRYPSTLSSYCIPIRYPPTLSSYAYAPLLSSYPVLLLPRYPPTLSPYAVPLRLSSYAYPPMPVLLRCAVLAYGAMG